MRLHPTLAFAGIVLGSALGSLHGCSSDSAHAEPGTGGAAGGSGASTCAPVTCNATCTAPGPEQLTTYADILDTLKSGARVRVVLDYAQCTILGSPGPKALGAMNMDTFEWFDKGSIGNPKAYVAASETHLVRLNTFINDYVRIRVFEDDKVGIEVKYLDPVTYAVSVDETIDCGISDAATARGATFFKTP
jgi:hypothetical protein